MIVLYCARSPVIPETIGEKDMVGIYMAWMRVLTIHT